MSYRVRPGDSLSSIARKTLGDGSRWAEIARINGIATPDRLLIGQMLRMPAAAGDGGSRPAQTAPAHSAWTPANFYLFVLADEVNPLHRKVVRRVLVNPKMTAEAAARLGRPLAIFPNPERFGFFPSASGSPLPPGRHALGMKPSPFLSASRSRPFGARRFTGAPFWIDEAKARQAGATFHEVDEIVRDLERIKAKSRDPATSARIQEIIGKVRADKEVLVRGGVPASAVKGPIAMGMTRGLQGVQVIGFALTAANMTHAARKSRAQHSAKPLVAETVRQSGGWAAAWAGVKLGAAGGALVGIETGPGALVTGAIGGVAGGLAGYYGFDWIADHIDEN